MFAFDPEGINARLAQEATDSLKLRGPDDSASYAYRIHRDGSAVLCQPDIGSNIFIGHRRLSIIGPTPENRQPFHRCGNLLAFNGEIYNFEALRGQLKDVGERFELERSDTEVLAAGLVRYGNAFLRRLNGMFAGILFDAACCRLHVFRDPCGQKPVFLYRENGKLIVASELKAIQKYHPLRLDKNKILAGLTLGYHGNGGPYEYVDVLPPGTVRSYQIPALDYSQSRFWEYRAERQCVDLTADSARKRFQTVFNSAVNRHLIADVPVGVHLSGGVDSTLVVKSVTDQGLRPTCFTISFDDADYDELRFAQYAAKVYGCDLKVETVSTPSFDEVIKLLGYYDEPFYDSSAVPTYYLNRLAADHVKVALGGDGADELFGGYRRYVLTLYGAKLRERLGLVWPVIRRTTQELGRLCRLRKLSGKYVGNADWPLPEALFYNSHDLTLLENALSPTDAATVIERVKAEYVAEFSTGTSLCEMTRGDIPNYLASDILTKADRSSMINGLEQRAPFLDREVLSFAAGLSDQWKIKRGCGKWLLKRILAQDLGENFAYRKKSGFRFPVRKFLLVNEERIRELLRGNLPRFGLSLALDAKCNLHDCRDDELQRVWKLFVLANFLDRQ